MDYAFYRPAADVLDQLRQLDFVAVVAPAGAGKTTLVAAAARREAKLHPVVGDTSRDPRPGEQEGVDYHFCTQGDMVRSIERRSYINVAAGLETHLYALNPVRFSQSKVNLMPIWAKDIPYFRSLPFRRFAVVCIVPVDYTTWHSRFLQRHFSEAEAHRRLMEAMQSFAFAREDESAKLVINNTLELAAEDLTILALGRPLPPRLQADQSRGREIAGELLLRLRRAAA